MSCYHPKTAWKSLIEKNPETGKAIITFKIPSPQSKEWEGKTYEQIEIPCGKCIGCRLEYSRQWALRIQKEASLYEHNWFLTITYNDMHLPIWETINKETGEYILGHPLNPEDLTKLMKRIRWHWKKKYNHEGIRFFACGEYGEITDRAHYHGAIMNFPIPKEELEPYKCNALGDQLYKCKLLDKIWGKGFVTVGSLTWQSAAYVARYILKKQKGDPRQSKAFYTSQGKIPEFTRCSRKPGIAREWYELHKDEIYKNDEIFVPKRGGGTLKLRPAQYFDRLYDLEHPKEMLIIKEARKQYALRTKRLKMAKCKLEWKEILTIAEKNHEERARKLIRKEM